MRNDSRIWTRLSTPLAALVMLCTLVGVGRDASAADGKYYVMAADSSTHRIAIIDPDGKTLWENKIGSIHDLHMLPSGNVLFQRDMQHLVEVDPATNKVVWEYDASKMNGNQGKPVQVHAFQRLADGTTMISESGPARIIEVDPSGKIVHEFKMTVDHPSTHRDTRLARRLDNGHYLLCHEGDGKVREYDHDGKVVWEYEAPMFGKQAKGGHGVEAFGNAVFCAIRLRNGNTLVATGNGHSVLEVTPDKQIVWKIEQNDLDGIQLAWVTTLQEMPNGNFIIGNCHAGPSNPQIIEVTRDKRVVWKFHDFERFGDALSNSLVMTERPKRLPGEEGKAAAAADAPLDDAAKVTFFEKEVKPLLESTCFKCHGADPEKIRGGMWLTSRANILHGGDSGGPAVDLDSPDKSLLVKMINYVDDDHQMPPKGKMSAEKIALLEKWVKMGVPWTPGEADVLADALNKPKSKITDEDRAYWAYVKPVQAPAPQVKNKAWVRNPIDAFILQKLEAKGIEPVGPADKVALVRRVYYDLIGLPPTPQQVRDFVNDKSPDAYEKLLDTLLASPHYGEKWGRHWLDVVRYAETNGYERDSSKPNVWRYRDYVIRSFNDDKPYDQFLKEQLAGDELDEVTRDSLIATGYFRLGTWDDEPADKELAQYDVLNDMLATTGSGMLGMSIGCTRCHTHKRDPIPHEDYYRLLAFFRDVSTDMRYEGEQRHATPEEQAAYDEKIAERDADVAKLYGQLFNMRQRFTAAMAEKKPEVRVSLMPASDMVDLSFRFYRDTWTTLPDNFDALRHESAGALAEGFFTLSPASRDEAIGLVFEGKLRVPAEGDYTFRIDATEGARLSIAGQPVLERKEGGRFQGKAEVALKAGDVPIRLEYFNGYQKPQLKVWWSGPSFDERPLSAEAVSAESRTVLADSRDEPQQWKVRFEKPEGKDLAWTKPNYADDAWETKPGGFGTNGTPGAKVRTTWDTNDIYLRRHFTVETLPNSLSLVMHHDEDTEVYVNGRLIKKVTAFTRDYETFDLYDKAFKTIKQGDNVIAVHCKQTAGGQYIDVGLVTEAAPKDIDLLVKENGREVMSPEEVDHYADLVDQLKLAREKKIPEPGIKVLAVAEKGRAKTYVLGRGNPALQREEVQPGFPQVLGVPDPVIAEPKNGEHDKRRLALANWITSRDNPLTARVMMNRVWQHHFGRGIVPTANDFGKLGEMPTHPELLDWLAVEFMNRGWSVKAMHKLIMTSNAYRMSSADGASGLAKDPANMLFWRMNMRRLTAEEIRDTILAANGTLNLKMYGPSIYTEIPAAVLATASRPDQAWGKSTPEEAARRSVYIHVKRSLVEPFLQTFDLPDTDASCAMRFTTTVPTQALTCLNSDFMHKQASIFASRLRAEAGDNPADQVTLALKLVSGREPTQSEILRGVKVMDDWQTQDGITKEKSLDYFCLIALNLNEFLYLD